jgi:hypothetical protein
VINPGASRNGEREHIFPRQLMVLEEELRVPHVPPDVRIIYVLLVHREYELQTDQDQGQHREK